MKKTNTTTTSTKTTTATSSINPFEALSATAAAESSSRRLSYSAALIGKANELTQQVILGGTDHAELAQKVITETQTTDLLELINQTVGAEAIKAAAQVLEGCGDEELSHLLESRRSDRSKAKKKGPSTSMTVCKTYISAFVAELMVREKMGKAYATGSGRTTSYNAEELAKDQDALVKKIKSLQSKQCRIKKLAEAGDAEAKEELEAVKAEIAKLQDLRVGKTKTVQQKVVIKSDDLTALRSALEAIDPATLAPDEAEKLTAMLSKLA